MIPYRHLFSLLAAIGFTLFVSCDSQPPEQSAPEPELEEETAEQADTKPGFDQIKKLQGDVTFTLDDGEALNRENPDSFWIPTKERRENLVKDDLVKLVFLLTDGKQTQGERMWVIVTGGDSSGYTGTLDNDPYSTDRIKAGHEVSFEPRHVIAIFEEAEVKDEAEEDIAD